MNKSIVDSLYSLIDSDDWVTYPTVPAGYKGAMPAPPFLRVDLVSGSTERIAYSETNKKQIDGILKVQVIVPSGRGHSESADIAEALDTVLEDYQLNINTKLGLSSLQRVGVDPADKTKELYEYSVAYTYTGD